MSNEEYRGKNVETEVLSVDDQKLSDLLGGLKRIDAPKNFDFRLKARIANTKPEHLRPHRPFPLWGYAAPLAVVLLAGAYFVGTGVYSVDNNSVSGVQEAQPVANTNYLSPSKAETVPAIENPELAEVSEPKPASSALPVTEKDASAPKKARRSSEPAGGSFDTGLGSKEPILPRGLNANSSSAKKPEVFAPISIQEILSTIGIKAEFDGSSIKVKSVVANSMAARSGIAAGDVLQTINGQRVTDKTKFESPFSVKSAGITRDGKSLQINLR